MFGQSHVLQQWEISQSWVIKKELKGFLLLRELSVSSNRVFILLCDKPEFNQNTDQQDCSLTLCARKPNAERLICFLSCDRQVAGSFYSQIMKRFDWGSGITMKMCTKSVSLVSRFITSQLFILLLIFCLSLNVFTPKNPLWPLVFSKSQWKTLSDKVAITVVKSYKSKMILELDNIPQLLVISCTLWLFVCVICPPLICTCRQPTNNRFSNIF